MSVRRNDAWTPPVFMAAGSSLGTDECIVSQSGDYFLTMQDDGNLCLLRGKGPLDLASGYVWSWARKSEQLPHVIHACYAILQTSPPSIVFYRVPYDWDTAAARIRQAGLPDAFARRLLRGTGRA